MKTPDFGDMVVDNLVNLMDATEKALKQQLGTQPFGAKPRSRREQLALYKATTPEDMAAIAQEFGPEAANRWIADMEKRRRTPWQEE